MNSKTLCVFLIAFAFQSVAGVAVPLGRYAGTVNGTNEWTPIVTTTGACAAGTTAGVKWEKFGITVASAGVVQVRCMYEQQWRSTGRALIYSGLATAWVPTAGCTGFVHEVQDNLGVTGGPKRIDGVQLAAGPYTVVVTGSTLSDKGLFACEVMASEINGTTATSNLVIYPISNEQSSACSENTGTGRAVQASAVSWTQTTTGLYDIQVYFYNASYPPTGVTTSFGANIILYRGNIIAQLNESVNDPCDAKFTAAYIISGRIAGEFVGILQNVSLTATNVYTAVFAGGQASAIGSWGFSVDPTVIRTSAGSAGTWTQPSRGDPSDCEPSSSTNTYFYAFTFVADFPTYIFDTQATPWDSSTYDTYSFLYSGINNASVPATCSAVGGVSLLYDGDTGDQRPLAFLGLNIGSYYTVIVSSYSGTNRGTVGVFAMTGTQIGDVPGGLTTGAATTGDPSAGATIGVSFCLLLIAAIFAF